MKHSNEIRTEKGSASLETISDSTNPWSGLAEALPDLILRLNSTGCVVDANRRWVDYTGVSAEGMGLGELSDVFASEDLADFSERWRMALKSGLPADFECRLFCSSQGEFRWQHGRLLPAPTAPESRTFHWYLVFEDIHHRKSQAFWANMVHDNVDGALVAYDKAGTIVFCQGKGVLAREDGRDWVGMSVLDIYRDDEVTRKPILDALAGTHVQTENLIRGRWYSRNFMPVKDAKGGVLGVVGFTSDVTERHLSKLKLESSERALRETVKELRDYKFALDQSSIFATTDHRGRIIHVNEKFCEISQYTREELIGNDHRMLSSGIHDRKFFTDFWDTISSGKVWEGDICNRAKDGSLYWVHTVIVPFLGSNGRPYQYVAIRKDITKRLEATEALAASETKFRKIYESSMSGLFFWDSDGTISDANAEFLRLLGYTRSELIDAQVHLLDSTPEEYHSADTRAMAEIRETGVCAPYSKSFVRKDGSLVPVMVCGALLPGAEGAGGIGFALDLTVQRNAEKEIMEAQVREQSALQASRLKSTFLAMMSHEFRTPLSAILGTSELLASTSDGAVQKECREIIQNSARALGALVNDFLDSSKIEAGKLEIRAGDFDLRELVQEVSREFQCMARERGLKLVTELPDSGMRVTGDAVRVRQVLSNLISNAMKFTLQGAVTLRVSAAPGSTGAERFRFEVIDTGIGIAPEDLGRLFEPFTQLQSVAIRRSGGTGLGLSISRRLVELMGGAIAVHSMPGVGSTFWFELPMRSAELTSNVDTHLEAPSRLSLEGARVLVVEDSEANQRMMALLLQKMNLSAEFADSGFAALELLESREYDLILMDCYMPEMDGYTTTAQIRASSDPRTANIPVIAVTAGVLPEDRERCVISGMNDFLPKPFAQRDLVQCLNRWLPVQSRGQSRTRTKPTLDPVVYAELLRASAEDGGSLLPEMRLLLAKNSPERIAALRDGIVARDPRAIHQASHALKSATAFLGAVHLAELCSRVDEFAKAGDFAAAEDLVGEIEAECLEVGRCLAQS